jgi:hypothetical protein
MRNECFDCGEPLPSVSDEQVEQENQAHAQAALRQARQAERAARDAERKQRPPSITALGVFSLLLIIIGIAVLFNYYNMDVTVTTESSSIGDVYIPSTTVNNIGLMDDRRNGIMGGFGILFIGIALAIVDHFSRLRKTQS